MADTDLQVNASLAFLRSIPGRHSLVAIHPETEAIEARLFDSADGAADWLRERAGRCNLYFTVNEPAPHARRDSKLKKGEIGQARRLWVDFDPAKDKPLEEERARIRAVLHDLPGNPTLVDTGGGYAAFWELAYPVSHADAERLNRALAHAFGGDRSAWNIDRVMRLPGTLNLPGSKKRAAGRTPALSAVLRAGTPTVLAAFDHLPSPPAATEVAREAEDSAVRAAAEAINATAWEAGDWLLIPQEARERLEHALSAHPRLAQLWRGAALKDDHDASRSGLRFSLARECRQLRLTPAEFAHLVQCSAALRFTEQEMGDAVRQLSRAWARHDPAVDPASWFNPVAPAPADIWSLAVEAQEERQRLAWIDPSDIPDDFDPPPREWEVMNWLPAREVTSCYGAGGVGKTLLAHALGICLAAGRPWMGQAVRLAVCLAFFGEDSDDELKRRHRDIAQAHGVHNADLGGRFRFVSRRAMDNRLATFDRDGAVVLTPLWHEIKSACLEAADRFPGVGRVLILDTLADIFSGSEIDRQQVNAFVKQVLLRLAVETGFAILVLAHPSAAGESSGSGLSGSTHWSAAVRSRWYMKYPDKSANPNVRVLEAMKNNYGPPSSKLQLEWSAGAFRLLAGNTTAAEASGVPTLADACENAVLQAFARLEPFQASMSKQGLYAPRLLRAKEKRLSSYTTADVETAIYALLRRGLLAHVEIGRDKARRPVMGYRAVEADGVFE